jgi:hypothetical protein
MLLTVTQSVPAAPRFVASLTLRIPWSVKFFKGNTACQPLRFLASDSGVALILPLLRNHQVELGLIPVCQLFKTEGLKKSLKFLPARQRFNKQIARHPELIDKSPPFGMADDEAPAWPKDSGCVPTGTRLVGDIAVHGVHENHVHAGWVEFEQGDVSSVGPDIWMLLAYAPQHPFCQIAGGYNSSSVGLNQCNQNAHTSSHIQHCLTGAQPSSSDNLLETPHYLWWLGSVKGIH